MLSVSQVVISVVFCSSVCGAFNQSSFSLSDATRFVKYCGVAYCTDPVFEKNQVEQWNCHACKMSPFVEAKLFSGLVADANGFVGYEKRSNQIIVAFAGTEPASTKNWVEDFDFPLVDFNICPHCKIHNGFYLTYLSVSKAIISLIDGFKSLHPTATISVTGHSLGAALAVITIAELSANEQYSSSLTQTGHFVFGAPRVGNKDFFDWYSSKASLTYRFVHGKDPVPHVPFETMHFHHVPYEIFYDTDYKSSRICDKSGEDESCSKQYPLTVDLADHLIYLDFNFMINLLSCRV